MLGIGFLGVGLIMLCGEIICGLMIVVSLWVVVVVGFVVGGGMYVVVIVVIVIVLVILVGLKLIEKCFFVMW